jgi:hypothetical protein
MRLYEGWDLLGRGDMAQIRRVRGSDVYACLDGGMSWLALISSSISTNMSFESQRRSAQACRLR